MKEFEYSYRLFSCPNIILKINKITVFIKISLTGSYFSLFQWPILKMTYINRLIRRA